MATKKEIRLTFNDKDKDIIEFLNGKTSKTGYIKDLIRLHMLIEQSYLATGMQITTDVPCETVNVKEEKQDEYDFDLSDLGL